MATQLSTIVADFADCIKQADARHPQAISVRSKEPYTPGIGPHSEAATVQLVCNEMQLAHPEHYAGRIATNVPYPRAPRQKCDLCIGTPNGWEWAIEIKMLRILGDNGKPNDNILMHILSPYPAHRSALTDCEKLLAYFARASRAILIYGYDHDDWPLCIAIEAFEALAATRFGLGPRESAAFDGLVHPVHTRGGVYAWELQVIGPPHRLPLRE